MDPSEAAPDSGALGTPYADWQVGSATAATAMTTLGMLLNALVFSAMRVSRQTRLAANASNIQIVLLNMALCGFKLVYAAAAVVVGRYPFGEAGCRVEGFVLQTLQSTVGLTILTNIVNPVRVVALGKPALNGRQMALLLGGVWISVIIDSSLPLWVASSAGYRPESSGVYCHLDFTSASGVDIFCCLLDVLTLTVTPMMLGGSYWYVASRLHSMAKAMKGRSKKKVALELESELARRGLLISITHMSCWFIGVLRMYYEMATRTRMIASINLLEHHMVMVAHSAEAAVLVTTDRRIRRALMCILRFLMTGKNPVVAYDEQSAEVEKKKDVPEQPAAPKQTRPVSAAAAQAAAAQAVVAQNGAQAAAGATGGPPSIPRELMRFPDLRVPDQNRPASPSASRRPGELRSQREPHLGSRNDNSASGSPVLRRAGQDALFKGRSPRSASKGRVAVTLSAANLTANAHSTTSSVARKQGDAWQSCNDVAGSREPLSADEKSVGSVTSGSAGNPEQSLKKQHDASTPE
ncbi:hypothetical protein HK105_207565 [Polyrhizophydium stewartii]|uniref:G-protein coupled receptors family 1 profile domain-containing protein n=1 Tax=Polyrhizophydium stewartii TaxID=2732419 RepID=A0ABR4N045_9FUNG|nr:hypothetical protein HK105_001938 [Polyrhizophydium stewartii]